MSIRIALADAATNCNRDGATATLTLKNGAQFAGGLQKPDPHPEIQTVHVRKPDGGWVTILTREIVAVETTPSRR